MRGQQRNGDQPGGRKGPKEFCDLRAASARPVGLGGSLAKRQAGAVKHLPAADLARIRDPAIDRVGDCRGRNLYGGWYLDITGCAPETVAMQIAVGMRLYGYRGACCDLTGCAPALLDAAGDACRVLGAPLLLLPVARTRIQAG
jgi:hypothetical protein